MLSTTLTAPSTIAPQTLNRILLFALQLAFPDAAAAAVVVKPGQRRETESSFLVHGGAVVEFGEEIQLDCPFCGDIRGRMRINHSYDPAANPGRWHCFNEECHKQPGFRSQFAGRLQAVWLQAKQAARSAPASSPLPSIRAAERSSAVVEAALPAGTVPIINLPDDHPAVVYLQSRNFDAKQLWNEFQVGYTDGSNWPPPSFGPRIVIPVVEPALKRGDRPMLLGWQARQIPGLAPDSHPDEKYLCMFGFHKSHVLYAATSGPQTDALFIVEGVSDVWRLGCQAVALLGKVASRKQLDRLVEIGQFCSQIYVALDRDAQARQQQLVRDLRQRFDILGVGVQVYSFEIPGGRNDVGECSYDELMHAKLMTAAKSLLGPVATVPTPSRCPTAVTPSPPEHTVDENEVASRLIENATGVPPTSGTDLPTRLQQLGLEYVYRELELPLQPILRGIEQHGLLVDDGILRNLVCNHPPLAAEAARLRRAVSRTTGRVHTELDCLVPHPTSFFR